MLYITLLHTKQNKNNPQPFFPKENTKMEPQTKEYLK